MLLRDFLATSRNAILWSLTPIGCLLCITRDGLFVTHRSSVFLFLVGNLMTCSNQFHREDLGNSGLC